MKNELIFDFAVDKENQTITVKREFDADLELVWEAWTTPEFLEKWIAPKPWKAETKTMDFREGGHWHYAMVSPQGEKHWTRYDYQIIESRKRIVELRGFSNEAGTINPDFPRTECTNLFRESDGRTYVEIKAVYGNLEVLEYLVKNGFKEGMSASLANLDELLETFKQ
ncbi:SRPBCC domain-containing protein [Fluviicola sp.]|uniref:SRPBCC family protein n=1 Tax=Fluviicola sp. TaxID=1917219 RepID=UPI0031E0582A